MVNYSPVPRFTRKVRFRSSGWYGIRMSSNFIRLERATRVSKVARKSAFKD
jgi:hypothetical protein